METQYSDIEKTKDLLFEIQKQKQEPIQPVKPSDVIQSFLFRQFEKIERSILLEEEIKDRIRSQLSEATFGQLIRLLTVVQEGNNTSISNILTPFLSNLSAFESKKKISEELDDENISKETIQALDELRKLFLILNKRKTILSPEEKNKEQIENLEAEIAKIKETLKQELAD